MPIVRPVPLTLDKPRSLLYTHQAVFDAERELSTVWGREYTFFQAIRQMVECLRPDAAGLVNIGGVSTNNLSILVWAGCQHEDPTLTLAQVRQALPIFTPADLLPYAGAVLTAWQAQTSPAIPDAEEAGDDNPLAASTGNGAGPMGVAASA